MTDATLRFALPSGGVRFGVGELRALGSEARARGLARILLVTDAHVAAAGIAARAGHALTAAAVASETLTLPPGEPVDAVVEPAVAAARAERFDGVVAVGGGSVIDSAKLIALLLAAPGELVDYVNPPFGGGRAPEVPPLPLIAVPTTAGSGSDVSAVAVLELGRGPVKTAVSHPALRPALSIADPEATIGAPPAATHAAGLDVLAHAVESLTARPAGDARRAGSVSAVYAGANPYSDALCLAALPLLVDGLPRAVADGADLRARAEVLHAATLANLGAAVAGAHAGHAAAYALAGTAPHGVLVGMLLPALVRELPEASSRVCARIARAIGQPVADRGDARDHLAGALEAFGRRVSLDEAAVVPVGTDAAALAGAAAGQRRLMDNAPEGIDERALERILRRAIVRGTPERG